MFPLVDGAEVMEVPIMLVPSLVLLLELMEVDVVVEVVVLETSGFPPVAWLWDTTLHSRSAICIHCRPNISAVTNDNAQI